MNNIGLDASFLKLRDYCTAKEFKGFDPYDGLNSKLFQNLAGLNKIKLIRLAWIQFFKRSPINFRKITGVSESYNPKAMGLFLSAYCHLYHLDKNPEHLKKMDFFIEKIKLAQNSGYSGICWGYNFDWESRAFFQPQNTPTIVPTCFISNGLLDAYEITGNQQLLEIARSACNYILKDLNRTVDADGSYILSYSPLDDSKVYNASLLAAKLMARVASFTQEKELFTEAGKIVTYVCKFQKEDGSWPYSPLPFHYWIDSFHSGYNLEAIADYMKFSGDKRFETNLKIGFDYYINTFFTEEGVPRCFSDNTYPIDIHSASQLPITLYRLGLIHSYQPILDKVMNWAIEHMQSKKGYFYYKKHQWYTIKIPYMRWTQAWMFLAFSIYQRNFNEK